MSDEHRASSIAGRRAGDKTLREILSELKKIDAVNQTQNLKLDTIRNDIASMNEILTAWNNIKGVGWMVKVVGKAILGLAAIGAAVMALFTFFKWIKGA